MKIKRLLLLIGLMSLLIFSFRIVTHASSVNGVMLDNARMYNSPTVIKRYMRLISHHGGKYLQLHVSDNNTFGLENKYLKQTPQQNSYQKHGIEYSKITRTPYLTKAQLKELYQYASQQHIQLVLEIDVPGHSQALLKLLKHRHYTDYSQVAYENELDYGQAKTAKLVLKILSEYRTIIPQNSRISLGGDEFSGSAKSDQRDYRKFVNQLDTKLNQWHYRLQLYNDGFYKSQLKKYHHNILVDYWSLDGQQNLAQMREANISQRATLPQLNQAGFQTINNNADYTYVVVDKDGTTNQSDLKKLLQKWNPRLWDSKFNQLKQLNQYDYGSLFSIWGEPNTRVNPSRLQHQVSASIEQFLAKANV